MSNASAPEVLMGYELIKGFVFPVVLATIAAYYSARLALKKFYKEKWWEKRLEAFTQIIDISYRIKMTNDYFRNCEYDKKNLAELSFRRHPASIEKELTIEYWKDLQELERISQLASFTLTDTASQILNEYIISRKDLVKEDEEGLVDSLMAEDKHYELSEKLLSSLVSEAKKELRC
ncbi:hypothetical protein [Siccibacter colletis]|uniref:DUF4760 domain-containing protein n=1 Tax=Siccibacter colletis TaxID=1505757 RepID=A0ABY6J8Z7_9ENTR|nr:hypothetical protein [Siccibacter colletis]UYU30325.1 hypothetical protein KFZ77_10475 [Siccibacter colletis]